MVCQFLLPQASVTVSPFFLQVLWTQCQLSSNKVQVRCWKKKRTQLNPESNGHHSWNVFQIVVNRWTGQIDSHLLRGKNSDLWTGGHTSLFTSQLLNGAPSLCHFTVTSTSSWPSTSYNSQTQTQTLWHNIKPLPYWQQQCRAHCRPDRRQCNLVAPWSLIFRSRFGSVVMQDWMHVSLWMRVHISKTKIMLCCFDTAVLWDTLLSL